jgi:hypothetical protein
MSQSQNKTNMAVNIVGKTQEKQKTKEKENHLIL